MLWICLTVSAQAQVVPIPTDEDGWYRTNSGNRAKVTTTAYRPEAIVLQSDRDYVDVVLRRVAALVDYMGRMQSVPDLTAERNTLQQLTGQVRTTDVSSSQRRAVYDQLVALRRRVVLKNPLLSFDGILLVEHDIWTDGSNGTGTHMCDQYYGFNAKQDGALLLVRSLFSGKPAVDPSLVVSSVESGRLKGRSLMGGSFLSPDLSYDGNTIVFAWAEGVDRVYAPGKFEQWTQDTCYHLFKVNIDGTGLTQLTDGPCDDFDPVWLPNGRIAFISTRRGGYGRCHPRPVPTYTLHSIKADGSDLIRISYHETNEWQPSVDDNTGMLVYSRWDYVDREDCIAHHPWTCFPDGSDPRIRHGNYPLPFTRLSGTGYFSDAIDGRVLRPFAEFNCRAIPGSEQLVATAVAHHGQAFGSLVVVDPRVEDDSQMSQVRRLTPDAPFPEAECSAGTDSSYVYGTAYPLSDTFFLCSYKNSIILLDAFGNREVLYTSITGQRPVDPIPLRTRTAPILMALTTEAAGSVPRSAAISIMNVYNTDMPLPQGVSIKEMRIVQIFPKSTIYKDTPRSGYGDESLCRMSLGTVPVEDDGSVYCQAPVAKEIYFQLLDANGMAVHSMKSGTYVHPGEHLSCLGCHENKSQQASSNAYPKALRRAPSPIQPELGRVEPMSFHRLVQPILQNRCATCHQREGKGPDMSYNSLEPYAWYLHGTAGVGLWGAEYAGSRTIPGKMGARISRLYANGYLDQGHHNVSLTADEKHMITLWLDLNSNEYAELQNLPAQQQVQLVWPVFDVDPNNPQGIQ